MDTLPCANQLQEPSQQPQQHQQQLVNLSLDANLAENMVSLPKELVLISLVSQEQSLYNPKHLHYRSTKIKDEKWLEIGLSVGWSDAQCKSKWKAMRDQYCRELKRAKSCAKAVKWKYFKELDFLRPYALARNYRGKSGQSNNGLVSTVPPMSLPMSNSFSSSSNSQNLNLSGSIKIEDAGATTLLDTCSFSSASTPDKKTGATFMASHIGTVLQQQQQTQPETNWNYLTDSGGGSAPSIIVQCGTASTTTVVDNLYKEIVDCVNAANHSTSTATAGGGTVAGTAAASNAEEEDDDPIHTFLNMESYFEKELITLIQQEDMIYNYSNENYRNAKLKMEVWEEIARKLKKSVKQCRLKWKALRDQYAREHKRLRTLMHIDATSRWKHYDSLSFLQKFIQQKSLDGDPQLSLLLPKHDAVRELEEHMVQSESPPTQQSNLESSSSNSQLNMPALPHLTGPHKSEMTEALQDQQQPQNQDQRHQQQQASEMCVATYDDMELENYINGDAHQEDDEDDEDDEEMETATGTDQAPQQQEQQMVSYDHEEGSVYMAVQTVSNALAKQEQASGRATHMEHQQLHSTAEYQQKLDIQPASTPRYQNSASTPSSSSTARYHSTPITTHKPTSHVEFPPTNGHNSGEDDEIGAFFKAVAMKIRNAQLEPVAFTDLQIDILRVINEALRNH
ncbi:hypothetical protein KR026_006421 [Drosophila bipectinata]|nr:hypothetical protein KR026_006421 [Drosophila bipectinata]